MEKFFELRMKNGKSFIVSTNEEGVCQFSINGVEYSIYAGGIGSKNFTFSAGKDWRLQEEDKHLQADRGLEVLSLWEIDVKRGTKIKELLKLLEELKANVPKTKKAFLNWKQNLYSATHGGIQTPGGWVLA